VHATPAVERILQESVYVANVVAKAMHMGYSCDEIMEEIPETMITELRIQNGLSDRFFADIIRSLNMLSNFLNLPRKNLLIEEQHEEIDQGTILFAMGNGPLFHPLALALRHNGYTVKIAQRYVPEIHTDVRVVISNPVKGSPLDMVLYENEQRSHSDSDILKIYLLGVAPEKKITDSFSEKGNIVFINRNHLDTRLVLHSIEHFFETDGDTGAA
jgi:hypothetical protein